MTYNVFGGTLSLTQSIKQLMNRKAGALGRVIYLFIIVGGVGILFVSRYFTFTQPKRVDVNLEVCDRAGR